MKYVEKEKLFLFIVRSIQSIVWCYRLFNIFKHFYRQSTVQTRKNWNTKKPKRQKKLKQNGKSEMYIFIFSFTHGAHKSFQYINHKFKYVHVFVRRWYAYQAANFFSFFLFKSSGFFLADCCWCCWKVLMLHQSYQNVRI